MNFEERFNKLIGVTDSYQAPERLMNILYDKAEREQIFRTMLKWFDNDVDFDWFHEYFQLAHADRKGKKQDFTPNSIGSLMAEMLDSDAGDYYETAAGTGGLLIRHWDTVRRQYMPFGIGGYDCWQHFHIVEELSDRTIPFLLFNMLIRGMNGIVIHADSITREAKGVFFIQNFNGCHLQFSDLNVMPYTTEVANEFDVKFEFQGKSTIDYYKAHKERSWYDTEYIDHINTKLEERNKWNEFRRETENNPELTPRAKKLMRDLGII